MRGTLKRLAGPAHLGSAAADVYNQGSTSIYDEIKQIQVLNKTANPATFSLFVGATAGSAAGTEIFSKEPVPAGTSKSYPVRLRMESTDFLSGICETGASTLAITVMGNSFIKSSVPFTFSYPGITAKVNSVTITVPGTAAVDDIAFLFQFSQNAVGAPTAVTPAGWTIMQSNTGIGASPVVRMSVHAKKIVLADIGATITGMNGDVRNDKMIIIFRPTRAVANFNNLGFDTNQQIVATVPSNQSLPVGAYTPPIIALAHYTSGNADAAVAGTSFSPAADGTEDNGTHQRVLYKIYNSSPANITVNGQTDAGAINGLQSNDSIFT